MKWAHLPEAGGLYDQNPELLERFAYIFGELAEEEKREEARQKAKQNASNMRPSMGTGKRKR